MSRGGQLGTSPAVEKNPEKHLAGTSSRSKDCRSPTVPVLKRKLVLWIQQQKLWANSRRKMKGLLLFGSKLYAIPPDFVSQCVKLDLAKHFRVLLCRSYEPDDRYVLYVVDRW